MFVTRKRFDREVWVLGDQIDTLRERVEGLERREREHRAQAARTAGCFSTLLHHLNLRFEYEAARPEQWTIVEESK
jgi:hypothetical protein